MREIMDQQEELKNRLWKGCGVRVAVPLLLDMPAYHSWTKDKIRLMCERSYLAPIPRGLNAVFRSSEQMKEVVLIQGKVTCTETRECYEGPCLLPKTYRTFRLHFEKTDPRILVIVRHNEAPVAEEMDDSPSALDLFGKIVYGIRFWFSL